jgi:hypothetical protein
MKFPSSVLVLLVPAVTAIAIPDSESGGLMTKLAPRDSNKALNVVLERITFTAWGLSSKYSYAWRIYETTPGKSGVCPPAKETAGDTLPGLLGGASPAPYWPPGRKIKDLWPGGIYDLKIGEHTYQYKNDGTNVGMLWTTDGQGKDKGFSCKQEQAAMADPGPRDGSDKGWAFCLKSEDYYTGQTVTAQLPFIFCEWSESDIGKRAPTERTGALKLSVL